MPLTDKDVVNIFGALFPIVFLLGGFSATLLFLVFPSTYWRLSQFCTLERLLSICRSRRGPSMDDNPVYNPGNNMVSMEIAPTANLNYDYSEIDMKKVQTLQPQTPCKEKVPGSYEDCVIDQNPHQYLGCGNELVEKETPSLDRDSGPHTYAILEPGSNKRLPVKKVTGTAIKQLENDPERIYFKLEPGTNKVILQSDLSETSSDHTYFILEKRLDENDEDNAYAVNDITDITDRTYFILEKEYVMDF